MRNSGPGNFPRLHVVPHRQVRGSQVLIEVLGTEFNGVLGCDYFGAYRKSMRKFGVLVQFCMAHLIRDVKFLLTLPGREDQAYGRRVRERCGNCLP